MIYWIFQEFFSHEARMLRIIGAAVLSFLIVLLLGPTMIRYLVRKKVGDRPEFDHLDLNQLTKHKSNTPTMGGVLIVLAIFVSILMFADLSNLYVIMALMTTVWLGGVGGWDDWLKLNRANGAGSRDGLKMWHKIVLQVGLAVVLSVYMYRYGGLTYVRTSVIDNATGLAKIIETCPAHEFYLPFLVAPLMVGALAHAIITTLTMVGTSNAVNLTDGMDGLAAGCMIIVAGVFMFLAYAVGVYDIGWKMFDLPFVPLSKEMTIVCASIIGACLGFLWYNAHPAQVFMGDTGSLTLGGLIGYVAVVVRQEFLLVIAGGIFVLEALSVILQVTYFKATKPKGGMQGKRLFRCAPLHHHFHLGGWAETKVVARFWIVAIVFAAIALATLKIKY